MPTTGTTPPLLEHGERCSAILEINPYRRRDGMLYVDSMMYPWFAHNGYLCFRVDVQGTGDSEGIVTDEYTEEELSYCVQLITQIAELPFCDGNGGMMGKSWSAINSLMVAARDDCPPALKAIIVCCGSDDRYNDDVHYMGGAMMMDNVGWPSSMWGWLPLPPDPVVVGAEEIARGELVFRYDARARAFIGDELFEEKHVEGAIPRIFRGVSLLTRGVAAKTPMLRALLLA